jgi:two-component system chemotaxis response regulator CheY
VPKRLLIADDAMIIRELIAEAVQAAGWEVVGRAADGREAIALYDQLRPDAVTLDLVMPHYDGLHALRGICGSDPAAKVVVVSALSQRGVLKEAIRLGATDFVVKPFQAAVLIEALDRAVGIAAATLAEPPAAAGG